MKIWIDVGLRLAILFVLVAILWVQVDTAGKTDDRLAALEFDTNGTKFNTDQILNRILMICLERDDC